MLNSKMLVEGTNNKVAHRSNSGGQQSNNALGFIELNRMTCIVNLKISIFKQFTHIYRSIACYIERNG